MVHTFLLLIPIACSIVNTTTCPDQANDHKMWSWYCSVDFVGGVFTKPVLTKESTGQPDDDERAVAISPFYTVYEWAECILFVYFRFPLCILARQGFVELATPLAYLIPHSPVPGLQRDAY